MIVVIEDVLVDIISREFSALRSNLGILDKIMKTSPKHLEEVKKYLLAKDMKVIKGYPRTPSELPCICIMLAGEDEQQDGLGDVGEAYDSSLTTHRESLEVMTDESGDMYISTSHKPVYSLSHLSANGFLTDPDRGIIEIYEGASAGDRVQVEYEYENSYMNNSSHMYECNYRVEVWSANSDLTVSLYHIVKWIMLRSRKEMIEEYNVARQKLGGGDYDPISNYMPEFVYRRTLTLWFQTFVELPGDIGTFVESVSVSDDLI